MLPIHTIKPILRKKLFIGYQWVEYLTALTILNGDWPKLILISVFVHAYMQMFVCIYIYVYIYINIWVCILRISMSRENRCAYCFEKCGSATSSNVVSLLWPQQTEDGCHHSMRNTLFKPFSSDCGMTRFRAYQTLIYIMWALRLTPIYHWFFFGIPNEKCIDSISSHCAINDLMNYVKLYSLIVLKNQCNIAELCVYRFKTAVIMCIHSRYIWLVNINGFQ